jgi:hypothetical protein
MVSQCERGGAFRDRVSYSSRVMEVVSQLEYIGSILAIDPAFERRARQSVGDQVV